MEHHCRLQPSMVVITQYNAGLYRTAVDTTLQVLRHGRHPSGRFVHIHRMEPYETTSNTTAIVPSRVMP